jgi:alpha-glucosidase
VGQVYLPTGPDIWYDFHSLEVFRAGETISVAAPLNRLPLLAPAGAIIPMTDCCEPADFAKAHDEPSRHVRYARLPSW